MNSMGGKLWREYAASVFCSSFAWGEHWASQGYCASPSSLQRCAALFNDMCVEPLLVIVTELRKGAARCFMLISFDGSPANCTRERFMQLHCTEPDAEG